MPIRPMAAEIEAFIAAPAAVKNRRQGDAGVFPLRPILFLAVRADDPHQPLGHDCRQGGGDHERLDAHVDQACHGRCRIVGVEGGKHQWPVRLACMAISAVSASRISPTMMMSGSWRRTERRPLAKVRSIFGLTWICPTPFELVLDRVLNGDDVFLRRIDAVQAA